jgi:VWFA-related protein
MRATILSFALATATLVFAQQPAQPQFAEEIEVRVIDVDVAVTDRHGNHLTGLNRDDFELYEDGKRVDIAYFSRIVDGRLADLPLPAVQQGESMAPPPATRTPLTWIVYIDQTNLTPQRRNQAMRQLQAFLGKSIIGGDRGVIAVADGRSFKLRQGLTDDRQLLNTTLAQIERERIGVSPTAAKTATIRGQMTRFNPNENKLECDYLARSTANEINTVIEEEAFRTRNAILALGALLDSVARLEGRMALVYLGSGFHTVPGMQLTDLWHAAFTNFEHVTWAPDPDRERDSLKAEVSRLYANFSAMRVTIYTVHASDLTGGVPIEDAGDLGTHMSSDRAQLTETGLAREMAERTGGIYFKVSQALATQMEAVRRDLSNYYSLGYKPTGKPSDTRRVKVKVKVDDARVRHRESVRERTRAEKAADALVASMVQPRTAQKIVQSAPALPAADLTAANPLGVQFEADRPQPAATGRDQLLPFRFSIQLESLTFARRGNAHRADFSMHFALVGKDGSVYPLESRDQSLLIPDADVKASASTGPVDYAWHIDLAPLKIAQGIPSKQEGMRLTVSVEDRASGVRSVITVPVAR